MSKFVNEKMTRNEAESFIGKKWKELTTEQSQNLLKRGFTAVDGRTCDEVKDGECIIDFNLSPLSIAGYVDNSTDESIAIPCEESEIYCSCDIDEYYENSSVKLSPYKYLKEKDNRFGMVFRMSLSEILRLGYDYLRDETPEEWEEVQQEVRMSTKPNSVMTADFQIEIMKLEREIVKNCSVMDIICYISTMDYCFDKE